ncbi:MAG: DUF1854 domain-containing protein [Bdellovibrionaceae bacterium]|nr:DUF1854 domain-containing protein [Bdellovibrionales bacterium]MCB9083228.1 DUF1854 domain-containing protein [Pseudobdellovibrionaceae bacterium]
MEALQLNRVKTMKQENEVDENHRQLLVMGDEGQLSLWKEGQYIAVEIRRCFPWSQPTQCLSIRNGDDEEMMFIKDVKNLEKKSQDAVLQAMRESGFFFKITRIIEAREEFELRHWLVETEQGQRRFQTRLEDWPRELPGGDLLIRDVYGDIYHVGGLRSLDQRSRELLWAFIE